MIRQLNNPLSIPKILDLAKIVPHTPLDVLEKMILSGINDKDSIIYVDDKNGEIEGFIFASQEMWSGKPVAFIQFCCVKPSNNGNYTGFELLAKVNTWAKERGIKNIITVVKRNPDGFIRKYKFSYEGQILKRRV